MEHPIFGQSKHQISSIGRDAWQCGTLVDAIGCKNQLTGAKGHRLRVETLLVEVILYLLRALYYLAGS